MLLNELFENTPELEIKQLSIDSRLPMKDCIFFCLSGIRYDGHDYIDEAIKNGANVIVYQEDIDTNKNAIFIKVSDVADCLNDVVAKFYDYPAKKMETYLACGCEGQSSVSNILYQLLNKIKPTASIDVLGINYGNHHLYTSVPTLTILDNQKYLNEFYNNGIKAAVFETDALSLSYKKLDSIYPDCFIYTSTNELSASYQEIGRDYYDILCAYLYTLDANTRIILNRDDASYDELIKAAGDNYFTYGCDLDSDYMISDVVVLKDHSTFNITINEQVYHFETKLLGFNNIYNLTAVIAALNRNGYRLNDLIQLIKEIKPIEGVVERIEEAKDYNVYVDCAKNIKNIHDILEFGNTIKKNPKNKIYVVWGINGLDDKNTLEEIAHTLTDVVSHIILTENNTYSGNIFNVLKEIHYFDNFKPVVIEDRIIAIESAIELLNKDDILFILGKGNETTIIRGLGKETYIGDKAAAIKAINKRLNEENDYLY